MTNPKPVFLFAFSNKYAQPEKEKLEETVKKLGGLAKVTEDMYVTDATHVIVPDDKNNGWCPKLVGAISSGKHILKTDYIWQSAKCGRFLPPENFIPSYLKQNVEHFTQERHKKPFSNTRIVVMVANTRRQAELKVILRDGGATVIHWTNVDFEVKPKHQKLEVDVVYTDNILQPGSALEETVKMRKEEGKPLRVLSYFAIFKIIQCCPKTKEDRIAVEDQLSVENIGVMERLHPQSKLKSDAAYSAPVRQTKSVVVTIESSDDDDDDDIQIIDEVKGGQMKDDIQYLGRPAPKSPEVVTIDSDDSSDDSYTAAPSDDNDNLKKQNPELVPVAKVIQPDSALQLKEPTEPTRHMPEKKPTTEIDQETKYAENEKKRRPIRYFGSSPEPKKKKFKSFGSSTDYFDIDHLHTDDVKEPNGSMKKVSNDKPDDEKEKCDLGENSEVNLQNETKTDGMEIHDSESNDTEIETHDVIENTQNNVESVRENNQAVEKEKVQENDNKILENTTNVENSVLTTNVENSALVANNLPLKGKSAEERPSQPTNKPGKKVMVLQTFDMFSTKTHEVDEATFGQEEEEEELKTVTSEQITNEQIQQYVRAFTKAQAENKLGLEMDEVLLRHQPRFDVHKEGVKDYEEDENRVGNPKLKISGDNQASKDIWYQSFDVFEEKNHLASTFFEQIELLKISLASCLYFPQAK